MRESRIDSKSGRPLLYIDGKREPACAYITYLDERSRYTDFIKEGYSLFSACASFSGLPLNASTGITPLYGIFDQKGKPDFSRFDESIKSIADACPHARIFPRVRISMPQWWVDEHPDQCCHTPDGKMREALFSDEFKNQGCLMLEEFISHIQASDYKDNIIGYQIAGGQTEEWFHFDLNGSISPCAQNIFNEYLSENYPDICLEKAEIPKPDDIENLTGYIEDELLRRYLEFSDISIAKTVECFARKIKELTGYRQVVGAFFGYVADVFKPLHGAGGLGMLLNSPCVDFFCSPNQYAFQRALGRDWTEYLPGESVKLHGKLYFLENDIRTCLTKFPNECRPGLDPKGIYTSAVWKGPDSIERSVWAVRKAFARQITHSNGLWWFDMWGGWYACEPLMNEMRISRELMAEITYRDTPQTHCQAALIIDETYPHRVGYSDPSFGLRTVFLNALGNTGIPYDILLLEDYKHLKGYKAVILPYSEKYDSPSMIRLKEFCQANNIAILQGSDRDIDLTSDELRARLTKLGVHCYIESGDVIYSGSGYLAIHALTKGQKTVILPRTAQITPLDKSGSSFFGDRIDISMKTYETQIFRTE